MGNKSTYIACPRDNFTRRHRLVCYPHTILQMRYQPPLLLSRLAPPLQQLRHSPTTQRLPQHSLVPQPLLSSSRLSTWEVPEERPGEVESELEVWDEEGTSQPEGEEAVASETAQVILDTQAMVTGQFIKEIVATKPKDPARGCHLLYPHPLPYQTRPITQDTGEAVGDLLPGVGLVDRDHGMDLSRKGPTSSISSSIRLHPLRPHLLLLRYRFPSIRWL